MQVASDERNARWTMTARICLALILMPVPLVAQRHEKPLRLSGVFQLGYTNSQSSSRFPGYSVQTLTPDLFWGLDLVARTYILDPRFISLSLEPSIMRASGSEDGTEIHRATTGGNFSLDFLPESSYPFHFHFVDQNLDYVQSHLSSSNAAHRSIGFDWMLRKPRLPRVRVSYDSSTYNYELSDIPTSLSHAKTFSILTYGRLRGWDSSLGYEKQATTEAFTKQQNSTNALRGNTRKELFSHSTFIANGLFQALRFGGLDVDRSLPFFNSTLNLNTKHTDKLSSDLFYRYSWIGNLPLNEASSVAAEITPKRRTSSNFFHSMGGSVNYQLFRGLSVGESTDLTFTSIRNPHLESPNRTVDVAGNINWSREIKFLQTRAGYQRGVDYVSTNFDRSRAISFDGYNAGFGIGDRKYVLLEANYLVSQKPDLFEIGGRFSQQMLSGSLESRALRQFDLRVSAGKNETDFLTSRGRERYHTATYSASVVHRRFTLTASRNSSVGLNNLLFSPLDLDLTRIFRILPVGALLNAPFSATFSVYTFGSASVKIRKELDVQFRYLRQRLLFPSVPNVLVKQYELFADYRLGKFLFSAGVLLNQETSEDLSRRYRRYYFFRVSRPFRIF